MRAVQTIIPRIIEFIEQERLQAGAHLVVQKLADALNVSRSPVHDALTVLADQGVVERQLNRGYFLAEGFSRALADMASAGSTQGGEGVVASAYYAVAEDLLAGTLPMSVSMEALRGRYDLTGAQVQSLLTRISTEGWAHRKPGYGWEFSTMLTTPDSLLQSYRMRIALEPAALLEPGYHLDPEVIERCRLAEMHLKQGGIHTDSAERLHDRGVRFHEALVEGSGNPFFIDTIQRVNKVRRLLSYRSMRDRARYVEHCEQHLEILHYLSRHDQARASAALRAHLESTLRNLSRIRDILGADCVSGRLKDAS